MSPRSYKKQRSHLILTLINNVSVVCRRRFVYGHVMRVSGPFWSPEWSCTLRGCVCTVVSQTRGAIVQINNTIVKNTPFRLMLWGAIGMAGGSAPGVKYSRVDEVKCFITAVKDFQSRSVIAVVGISTLCEFAIHPFHCMGINATDDHLRYGW